jgi:hypothetical protein
MKIKNFNKIASLFGIFFVISISSCVKDFRTNETNLNHLQPTVNIAEGGLYQFGTEALLFPGTDDTDTAYFHVNYAARNVAPSDQTFALGIDTSAISAYNTTGGLQYQLLPSADYSFTSTSVKVAKGQSYSDPVPVIFYPSKIDPTVNYMLPITITQAPAGVTISSNVKTIYYHFIGNPFAGTYVWDFTRWSNPSKTGSPDGTSFTGNTAILSPVTNTQFEVPSGYYIGPRYEVTFTKNADGTYSNFQVTLNPDDVATMASAGVVVTNGPNIITADPINKTFTFQYTTLTRYVIDSYHK